MKNLGILILTLWTAPAWADCQVPTPQMTAPLLKMNQQLCLQRSRFLGEVPNSQSANYATMLISPENKDKLINGSTVHCRFVYQVQNGASSKFRCAQTNENNQLVDSKGEIALDAKQLVANEDDVFLADENGVLLKQKKDPTKNRKAQILKVRYTKADRRHVENYTSTAASRILWALGIPAHTNIMTEFVSCFGCNADPFQGQKTPTITDGNYSKTNFKHASIEIKFEGKRMYSPLENPWDWAQVNSLLPFASEEKHAEVEAFALVTHFLTFTSTNSLQNALVCADDHRREGQPCLDVVAMTHDIGAAFGTRLGTKKGNDHPRGDIAAYTANDIFKKGTCQFAYTKNDNTLPRSISKQAQQLFLKRAAALDASTLRTLFAASKLGALNLAEAGSMAQAEEDWVQAIKNKIFEIEKAPCN